MNPLKRILPVALIAALLGGSVGAFVMRPGTAKTAETVGTAATPAQTQVTGAPLANQQLADASLTGEQAAFRDGFEEGFLAAQERRGTQSDYLTANQQRSTPVVYQNNGRSRRVSRSGNNSRRAYYDYEQPKKRSFWQKHRDKLTVAMGTGGGALVGGLIGGKKGALIGGLAGAGGSALYTYKLRKRDPRR
jgi:hypothetical protein